MGDQPSHEAGLCNLTRMDRLGCSWPWASLMSRKLRPSCLTLPV